MNVVVVDDDPVVRLVLAKAVNSMGHVSLAAESGAAALNLVEKRSVDVVISDWMMPGMTGLDLCRPFGPGTRSSTSISCWSPPWTTPSTRWPASPPASTTAWSSRSAPSTSACASWWPSG